MKLYLVIMLLIFSSCNWFLAGSYPYAESYNFECSKSELIAKIADFKIANPEFQPVKISLDSIIENYPEDNYTNNFYHCYFYINNMGLLHCVINVNEQSSTTLFLTSISKSENLGDWKRINTNDLQKKENKKIKEVFETVIIKTLKKCSK